MRSLFLIMLVLAGLSSRAQADPLSCDQGIAPTGNSAMDRLLKCGEPFCKTSDQEELKDVIAGRSVLVTVEEWTYNFGPQHFLPIITFRLRCQRRQKVPWRPERPFRT
jgi:Protein of unknown function (DUF2845)